MSSIVATAATADVADERRQIEAAADLYERLELDADPLGADACKAPYDDSASEALAERSGSRRSSSASTSSNDGIHGEGEGEGEGEGDETPVMAADQRPRDLLVASAVTELEADASESEAMEQRFSCVSLGDKDPLSITMEKLQLAPPAPVVDVSRAIMFNRYARAVPSAQESQSCGRFAGAASCLPKELSVPATQPLSIAVPASDSPHICCSASCQEQAKWKDERLHELQRALDHIVDAMAIQQRDMAAQRAFLSRQSEQLTKLSMALHQEKLSLQIEKERAQKAARAAACSPTSASSLSCRPPTPSGSSSRSSTPRGSASKPKAAMKAVFSTLAGSSSSRTDSGRRCTVSSIDEHAVVAAAAVECSPAALSAASARSASTSQLAPVVSTSLQAVVCSDSLSLSTAGVIATAVTEGERSMSLSALEIRTTSPTLPLSSLAPSAGKMQLGGVQMSDVSLQDSPVRFGSRSATNCVVSKKDSLAAASTASPSASAGVSPTASGSGDAKKSLGERFRSLRWKS